MKLIDLLVQELPKRGGWPAGVDAVEQDSEGQLFEMESDYCSDFKLKKCDDWIADVVTRQQYESALATSQKPAWNGEGLPPAGCECEYQYKVHGSEWCRFECVAVDGKAVFGWSNNTPVALQSNTHNFRPLRTEAERKHEAVLESICAVLEMVAQDYKREDEAKLIYEAIAAGKIPGVKLDD